MNDCPYLGRELTGPERQAAGLSHARKWSLCLHPDQPLGPTVCPCNGCGPQCVGHPDYKAAGPMRRHEGRKKLGMKPRPRPVKVPTSTLVCIPTPPPLDLTPRHSRAVVTVVVGDEAHQCFAASGPAMAIYAARVGADFVVLDDYKGPPGWPMGAKFGIARVLDYYDRIVYADADVLFRPKCVNLFELCGPDEFGAVDELPFHRRGNSRSPLDTVYDEFRRREGFPVTPATWYVNAGVMVVSRAVRDVIEPPLTLHIPIDAIERHCTEQNLLNARLFNSNHKVRFLPREANWQNYTDPGFRNAPPEAILHWSGSGARRRNRAQEIRTEAARHYQDHYANYVPDEWTPPAELFPTSHRYYADLTHVRMIHDELMTGDYGRVLEIGCFHGYSTCALLDAHRAGKVGEVHLCEPYPTPELRKVIEYYQTTTDNPRIVLHAEKSDAFLAKDSRFDFVFVDGDHTVPPVTAELQYLVPAGPKCLMAHDVTASIRGLYGVGGGPALIEPAMRAAGYTVTVDDVDRFGERTERGLLKAVRLPPASPASVRLSLVVATVGRSSLAATLESIRPQMRPGDELLVQWDGAGDMGSTPRTRGMKAATGTHILFMDDDDVYLPDALTTIRKAVSNNPSRVHLFGMTSGDGWSLPSCDNEVRVGNVSTQMVVVPNDKTRLGVWGTRRCGDFDFIVSTLQHYPEGPVWHSDVISVWRPKEV